MKDNLDLDSFHSLKGHLLVAMPNIDDPRFEKAVIYIYAHSETHGAQGIIINRPAEKMVFNDILDQLNIFYTPKEHQPVVLLGGPDRITNGFILHTTDYTSPETTIIQHDIALTSTQNILEDIACDAGPYKSLIALGCATWIRGQIEDEIMNNVWLTIPADPSILFDTPYSQRWSESIRTLGIQPYYLTSLSGKA